MSYLTPHANDLLEFEYPDSLNIISVYEDLGNDDGFEEDAHQYALWELWIYYEEDGERVVDKWIWEEWYCGGHQGYVFDGSYTPEQLWAHPQYSTYVCPFIFTE